ncbi:MAG TPA: PEP-CTERM sorting domain-containing protein [Pirellulaceae bacterium]|nr:PEP-CTERM sorting domain-containing protein [Pirellulaceae bacterium]HMO91335.1 PEP-CTERM sorting domain-containing protein [Pirellulaceae bacterium]HMP70153.1 PEP-CTERM sorting domain-containing protein [Pirellulaceae bacterium]
MKFFICASIVPLACMILLCGNQHLHADIVWDESVNGDLSGDPLGPTPLTYGIGANTIIASVSEPDGDLRDYITFSIGPNQFLTSLTLDAFSPNGFSFQGINAGNTSYIPDFGTAGNFLGLDFVSDSMVGTNMLLGLSLGDYGSIGFAIPLGEGTYSYVFQELTPGESRNYQITFHVVPEPASAGLSCLAGLFLLTRRRRK